MRAWIRAVGAACAALLALSATSAVAVIGGQPDNGRNPNVGMILGTDVIGPLLVCTGTLVNPTTVVTAAHCIPPFIEGYGNVTYEVTFNDQVAVANGFPTPIPLGQGIAGTPVPNPAYDQSLLSSNGVGMATFAANGAQDIGVLRLAAPVTGITPAQITGPNTILQNPKPDLLQVGYGDTRVGPPGQASSYFMDGYRHQSVFPLKTLKADLAYGNANPNDANGYGLPAAGDSGSPWFLGDKLGVVFSFSGPNNTVAGPRLDTGPGREFLRAQGLVP